MISSESGGPEVNGCDHGLDIQEQLALAPLATAALSVEPTVGVASKQHLSQTRCSGGAPFKLWHSNDTQPMADLK